MEDKNYGKDAKMSSENERGQWGERLEKESRTLETAL